MKRTTTTLALLAGFGGGCTTPDRAETPNGKFGAVTRPAVIPGVQGPGGEPVTMTSARGAMPTSEKKTMLSGVVPAGGKAAGGKAAGGKVVQAHLPAMYTDGGVKQVNGGGGPPVGGILPVPGMGPPGAVAAVGAMVPPFRAPATNARTSIQFNDPPGMKITWQLPTGGFNDENAGLTTPNVRYNFMQGQVYRLRLSHPRLLPRPLYPTLEVAPATPRTVTFLAHASVPVSFSEEDIRQATEGNLVVKVVYLPDPQFQDFAAVGGLEEIVSTRLEPGADPVAEAQRRGTILAVTRLGNIDLENRISPAMTAPPGSLMAPPPGVMVAPPGAPIPGPAVSPSTALPGGPVGPAALPISVQPRPAAR